MPPLAAGFHGPPVPPIVHNKWAHLGDVDLGTRGFECQVLRLVGDPYITETSQCGEIQMEGICEFQSTWEFDRLLSSSLV